MGTGKPGRYLNTKGSGRTVSDFAVVHSQEGRFVKPQKGYPAKLRLAAGGHGQSGMDLLDKYGIKYNIVKTYPNGVRVGNIPNHKNPRKQKGTGQSWFPRSWTDKDVKRAGTHVAGLKGNRHVSDGIIVYGTYKGVRVGVIRSYGKISTVFPDSDQTLVLNKRRRKNEY